MQVVVWLAGDDFSCKRQLETKMWHGLYKGPETSSEVNTFTNVIERYCLQQITGTLQRCLRHKLLCTYFRPRGICPLRFIMFDWDFGVVKSAILRFNNRNLNFKPLPTKISNKNVCFMGTLNHVFFKKTLENQSQLSSINKVFYKTL